MISIEGLLEDEQGLSMGEMLTVKFRQPSHEFTFGVTFQHCRPVILVDGTFLTGKYRGTLMMAVAVDPEQQLVPLAFALAESENGDSWSWFMRLVRINILGPTRQVCMISDRHHGLIKCASDHLDGYQPLVHRWCIRHFAANMWRRQKNNEVIGKL
jgi:transposase-like protein